MIVGYHSEERKPAGSSFKNQGNFHHNTMGKKLSLKENKSD